MRNEALHDFASPP